MVDEIQNSLEAQRDTEKVTRIQRRNALFGSVSDTFKFVAGIFTAAAMAMILPVLASQTTGIAAVGLGASVAAIPAMGLAVLGVAALATAIAVGSQYFSSRGYQSGVFNSLEVNAKHTAKYLVKEIESHNMCLSEHERKRADGKSWGDYTRSREATAQQNIQI